MSELSPDKRGEVAAVDKADRWIEIQALSAAIARLKRAPTEVEAALCGAVVRARDWLEELEALKETASVPSHVARKPDERDHAILKAVLTERAQAIALAHRLTTTEGYGACTTGGIRILCEALLRVDEALLAVPSLSETFAASTTRQSRFDPAEVVKELARLLESWGNNQLYMDARETIYKAKSLIEFAPSATPCNPDTARLDFLQTTVHYDEKDPEIATFDDNFWVQERLPKAKGDLRKAIDETMRAADGGVKT